METTCLITTMVLFLAAPVRAEEFRVNTRISGAQCNAAVAVTAAGDFVVAWSSYYSSSGRSNEIIARRFDRTGTPLDIDEFQVNTTSAGNQTEPAVAINADGSFCVVWQGPGPAGVDIFARLFDPNGEPLTDEVLVNAEVAGRRACPRVAAGDSGSFVVVWEDTAADANSVACIWGRSLDAFGVRQPDEVLVAADIWDSRYPDVATDAAGNFVVTWLLDRTGRSVHARLFDANGLAVSRPFAVSEVNFSSITRPAVAMDAQGRFVVTWDGDPNLARCDDVHARCFEPNGAPQSSQFLVNELCAGAQQWPRVAVNDANGVVFVWQSDSDDPNLATSICARRFDLQGRPVCEEICLNPSMWDKQRYPDIALAADGTFAAVWESTEPGASNYDIIAIVEPPIPRPDPDGDAQVDPGDLQDAELP